MATDFFERQAAARKSTAWLVAMFVLAVVAIVAATFVATAIGLQAAQEGPAPLTSPSFPWEVPAGAALGALALVSGGSLFKVAALRMGGGGGVAEGLGGRRLLVDGADAAEKRLLNVVDEMAIASGVPSPPVFLIEEPGINAFAAGYSPSDAVLGVTRGAIDSLTRDQLQGVIAHEFSHVLNGDMRMSIRMIGVLHGVLLLGLIGRLILRLMLNSHAHVDSRRSGSDGSGRGGTGALVMLAVGVALLVIGSVGSLIGGLIKAAVSRQREHLADASAVQFTRNPEGIAGALKRIAASVSKGKLRHPRAAELSHMYFTQGVWEGFTSLMATHPPLEERIRALDPAWDGSLPDLTNDPYGAPVAAGAAGFIGEVPVPVVRDAVDHVGEPMEAHRRYAAELLRALPEGLARAAREPFGARAVLYALLLDHDPEVRQKQLGLLGANEEPRVVALVERLTAEADALAPRLRLPLVDLTLPALAALSRKQYQRFAASFAALASADERVSLFEWVLSQVLLRHLRPKFEPVRSPRVEHASLARLGRECSVVLSALAHRASKGEASRALRAGGARLQGVAVELLPAEACGLEPLRAALDTLSRAVERERGRVVDAAAATICSDGHVAVAEAELLRGVSDLLECPMPPLLPEQEVAAA